MVVRSSSQTFFFLSICHWGEEEAVTTWKKIKQEDFPHGPVESGTILCWLFCQESLNCFSPEAVGSFWNNTDSQPVFHLPIHKCWRAAASCWLFSYYYIYITRAHTHGERRTHKSREKRQHFPFLLLLLGRQNNKKEKRREKVVWHD